jgi:hypothetical protein
MMKGFSVFSCRLCKRSVTTRDFSSLKGNCRTQAARTMNEHATAAHDCSIPVSLRDAKMEYAY